MQDKPTKRAGDTDMQVASLVSNYFLLCMHVAKETGQVVALDPPSFHGFRSPNLLCH